jgi:serine/threonine protein phosphatase 1
MFIWKGREGARVLNQSMRWRTMVWRQMIGSKRRIPRLPEGVRIYAVGDVHGRADLLEQVFAQIDADLAAYPRCKPLQVFLGDYIDRGLFSREVIESLIRRSRVHQMVCLKGNHENYVFDFFKNPATLSQWRTLGGLQTLMSYGLQPPINPDRAQQAELAQALDTVFPKRHRRFLRGLPRFFSCGDFFFVHAGVRPGVSLAEQREEDLLSIRNDFLVCEDDFGKIVIHGHTPVTEPDIRPNRINIDTGAYATGRLTCLIIESGGYFVLS